MKKPRRTKTKFKLICPGGTINTVEFPTAPDRDPAKARIEYLKGRWEVQDMFANESLRIIEE